jgi:hypothetical protein
MELVMTMQHLFQRMTHSGRIVELNSAMPQSVGEDLTARYGDGIRQLVNLLLLSNGFEMGGLVVLSNREVYSYDDDLVAFQNWGKGDFDCVRVGPEDAGSVWFTNHSPTVRARVAGSISDWLIAVEAELLNRDTIWHPRDYFQHPTQEGVYASVVPQLAGTHCELMGG